jgi:putative transposase
MKRLRQLEEENGKSKKIVADPSLDKAMLQDVIRRKTLKPVRQRQMVDHVRSTWRVSVRCACRALPVERSTYHYRYRRAGQDQL